MIIYTLIHLSLHLYHYVYVYLKFLLLCLKIYLNSFLVLLRYHEQLKMLFFLFANIARNLIILAYVRFEVGVEAGLSLLKTSKK